MFKRSWIVVLAIVLAQPAAADPAAFRALQAIDARVLAVGHRLATASAMLCRDARPLPGFLVHMIAQYAPDARDDARAAFALDERPAVLAVAPTSAAARAGLRAGDVLVAIGGRRVAPVTPGPRADYAGVAAIEAQVEAALAAGPLALTVARGGREEALTIAPERGCPTRFQTIPSDAMQATADGTYVQASSAIVAFTTNDDELAILLGHELAHNMLRHRQTLDQAKVSRGLLRILPGNRRRIKATEVEADRLAVWLAARAGYDIAAAPGYWDRLGRATGYGIFADGTHAGRAERVRIAEAEIAAVRAALAKGTALVPPVITAQQSSSHAQDRR